MSIENFNKKQLSPRELAAVNRQILLTSANVIDQIGNRRERKGGVIFDADWEDQETGRCLRLQTHTARAHQYTDKPKTTYFLKSYPPFSHHADEFYRYSTQGCDLEYCDEDWQSRDDVVHVEYNSRVLDYLGRAVPQQNSTDAAVFRGLVAELVLNKDSTKRISRAISVTALIGAAGGATHVAAKLLHMKEPLLSEAEISEAITWHRRSS